VASAQGDGDARSEMEKLLRLVAARGGGEGVQMELTTRSGRRVGCSCHGQQRQDARGVW